MAEDVLVGHRGLALMLCDEVSVLEETLKILGDLELHVRRLGSRGFLVPADEMSRILDILAQSGTYPRVVRAPALLSGETEEAPS